jgi:hypothetical protein
MAGGADAAWCCSAATIGYVTGFGGQVYLIDGAYEYYHYMQVSTKGAAADHQQEPTACLPKQQITPAPYHLCDTMFLGK